MEFELKDQKHLQALIDNNIPEDTGLDYKDPEALNSNNKNRDIAIDVSAMANSDGGIIIYGICEDDKKMPSSIKWIEKRDLKEKIMQVIQTRIVPQIEGITYEEITSDSNKNKFVLIVKIPKSYGSPHQVHLEDNGKRYFGRNGSVNRQLEHHEIEALFYRRKGPLLEFDIKKSEGQNWSYDLFIKNNGSKIGQKVIIKCLVPEEIEIGGGNFWHKEEKMYPGYGKFNSYQYYNDGIPCFPGLPSSVGKLYSPKKKIIENLKFSLFLACADMELRKFDVVISLGGICKINLNPDNSGLSFPNLLFLGDWPKN